MPTVAIDTQQVFELYSRESEFMQRRAMGGVAEFADEGGAVATNVVKVNQLDLTMPWTGFNNFLNNCGPSCVSMVMLQAIGKRVWPDEIADWMRGENHRGYTNLGDLERYQDAHSVPTDLVQFTSLIHFQAAMRMQVAANRLSTLLLWSDWEADTGGHFQVLYGTDEPGMGDVGLVNPWKGVIEWHDWEDVWGGFKYAPRALKALKGPLSYEVKPESWTAWTTTGVNARKEPFIKTGNIVRVLPGARKYEFDAYTDQGTAVGPNGNRRWHKRKGVQEWVSDTLLYRWQRV